MASETVTNASAAPSRTKRGHGALESESKPNADASVNGKVNGHANGHANGVPAAHSDDDNELDEAQAHTPLENLVAVSATVLLQAADLVANVLDDDAQLTYVSKYIPGSTMGKHLRHARDHFALLLDSVAAHPDFGSLAPESPTSSSAAPAPAPPPSAASSSASAPDTTPDSPELCYDVRARGTPMEASRSAARAELERQVARLHALVDGASRRRDGEAGDAQRNERERESKRRMDAPVRLSAVTPHLQTFGTTFGRELWFAALHAVHHWSMIRVIAGELNIQLDKQFGIAPSTLVYHGTEGPLGKSKI